MGVYLDVEIDAVKERAVYRITEWAYLGLHVAAGVTSLFLSAALQVPVVLWALFGLMTIDITTGFVSAWINRDISSDSSLRGMAKKALVILLILAVEICARAVGQFEQFGLYFPAGNLVAGAFCVHELVSIVENVLRAGVEPPYFLRDLKTRLVRNGKEMGK